MNKKLIFGLALFIFGWVMLLARDVWGFALLIPGILLILFSLITDSDEEKSTTGEQNG